CFVVFFFFSSRRRHTRFSRDWSSDVCSSDLRGCWETLIGPRAIVRRYREAVARHSASPLINNLDNVTFGDIVAAMDLSDVAATEIGRASCRERVERWGGGGGGKKKRKVRSGR